jgi:hypothetical protein
MNSLERDHWLAVVLLGGLATLLTFAAMSLGGSLPVLPKPNRRPANAAPAIPVGSVNALFAPPTLAQLAPPANMVSPFYTTYYQPPTPAAPTTRKVALTYQGFVETADGQRRAFLKVDETLCVGPVGSKVVADLVVMDIGMRKLVLTNLAQTNVLEFNARKELEVPVQ